MPSFFVIHDMVDKSDPQGRTIKEVNLEKPHTILVRTLVELENGARMFVADYGRDCDGTPIYWLCHKPDDTALDRALYFPDYPRGFRWIGAFAAESLTVVPASHPEHR